MTFGPRFPLLLAIAGLFAAQAFAAGPGHEARYERYKDILKAQYSAKVPPTALRPEEARKIYEVYLKSIGRPTASERSNPVGTTDSQPR